LRSRRVIGKIVFEIWIKKCKFKKTIICTKQEISYYETRIDVRVMGLSFLVPLTLIN
jgi:hypothetical protein